jgi:hypothetical protein
MKKEISFDQFMSERGYTTYQWQVMTDEDLEYFRKWYEEEVKDILYPAKPSSPARQ